MALNEDTGNRPIGPENRLVKEVEEKFGRRRIRVGLHEQTHVPTDKGVAGRENAVEQLIESLTIDFGKRFTNRLTKDVAAADELVIGFVRQFEHVIRPS